MVNAEEGGNRRERSRREGGRSVCVCVSVRVRECAWEEGGERKEE